MIKITNKQIFYSSNSAFEVELSKNGIFFSIAPLKEKKQNINYYNWKEKAISKISLSELCNLLEGLKHFRETEDTYTAFAQFLFGEKYRNYQFVHKNPKRPELLKMVGWNNSNGSLQFVIRTFKGKENLGTVFFTLQKMDMAKLQMFLEYLVEQAFNYDAFDDNDYSNDSFNDDDSSEFSG